MEVDAVSPDLPERTPPEEMCASLSILSKFDVTPTTER